MSSLSPKFTLIRAFKRAFNLINLEIDKLAPRSNPDLQLVCGLKKFNIDLVLDIGANEGQFASAIRYFGYQEKILSFEPLLSAHSKMLSLSKRDTMWEVYQRCAIGDYDGDVEINVSNYSVSSSILKISQLHLNAEPRSQTIGKEKVNICRIDSIASPYLECSQNPFLKIDTQGFEWQVLNGCENSLSSFRGILCELSLVSLYESQYLWKELLKRIEDNGFTVWAIQPGFTDPLDGRTLQLNVIFFRDTN
jgi:FkbM family methyltransferase